MIDGILIGLTTVFSPVNILMVVGGCLIGTFIGMLPGLGPMSIIAIMIPIAITIGDPSCRADFAGWSLLRRNFRRVNLINPD